MYDLEFVAKSWRLKKEIVSGNITENPLSLLEKMRPSVPSVFQLETTNVCNMKCVMCPRTEQMERKLGYMDVETFSKIVDQLQPHTEEKWNEWKTFVDKDAMVNTIANDEDHFYFMICSQTLILHGFGEPILDKTLPDKISIAAAKGLPTYFSMNPVNIKMDRMIAIAEAGLDYLKLSLEGMDNATQLKYRGKTDKTFDETLRKIIDVIELYRERNYKTKIIITKLNFRDDFKEQEEYLEFWKQYPVIVYVKNQHNRWLYEEENVSENSAEYMQRYCEFPWSSVSILYDGSVVPCPLDYEGKLTMGNIKDNSLEEIWNNKKYDDFRKMHAYGGFPADHFCVKHCDFNHLHEFVTQKNPEE